MIKLLLLALVGFILYSLVAGLLTPGRRRQRGNRTSEGEDMVKDPQCGTYLPRSEAVRSTVAGREHFFCSRSCLNEYKKAQKP